MRAAASSIQQSADHAGPVDLALLLFQAQGEFATLLAGDARAEELGPSEVAALLALSRGAPPV